MSKKNVSTEHRVQGYVRPQYKKLLQGYKLKYGESESKVVTKALKNFLDALPNDEKAYLLRRIKNNS